MNNPSKFNEYFKKVLRENMTTGSVGMGATGTQFSGDTYATGDARIPTVIGAEAGTRVFEGKKKKKKRKSSKRRKKYQAGQLYDSNIPMIRRSKIAM